MKETKGFTLLETVLMVVLLGVAAVSLFPSFFDVSLATARENYRDAVVKEVQAAVALYGAKQKAAGRGLYYPKTLQPSGSEKLFSTVLPHTDVEDWLLVREECYVFDRNQNGVFDNGEEKLFKYDSSEGLFVPAEKCEG